MGGVPSGCLHHVQYITENFRLGISAGSLGVQYWFVKYWLWPVGAAYDISPVDDANKRMPDLSGPADQHRH